MMTIKFHSLNNPCSFRRLPDDIVLEILSKVMNLRTLCVCKLVCKRFYKIVRQVDIISISYRRQPSQLGFPKRLLRSLKTFVRFKLCIMGVASRYPDPHTSEREFIKPAIMYLENFRRLKSLYIEIPSFFKKEEVVDNDFLFKWEIKSSNNADSFMFLSPTAICYSNSGNRQEEEEEENTMLSLQKYFVAKDCWFDAMLKFITLLGFYVFPLMEKLSITESSKRGRISLSGKNIDLVRLRLSCNLKIHSRVSKCYIPLLELPVSRCMMKGVNLYFVELNGIPYGDDNFRKNDLDDDDIENKDEVAAYNEAVIEIFKKHRERIHRRC